MSESLWKLISISICLLILLVGWYLYQPPPTELWTTVVGVERGDSIDELLIPLKSDLLISTRMVEVSSPFVEVLKLQLPEFIESILVAIYKKDPHLNWRKAHLLYQGSFKIENLLLVFPLLGCPKIPQPSFTLKTQETLLLIKPDLFPLIDLPDQVFQTLKQHDLTVLATMNLQMDHNLTSLIYDGIRERPFFEEVIEYMIGGKVLGIIISGERAVEKVRSIVGPTDPIVAKEIKPDSLRARFGKSKTINGFHASDSVASAAAEIKLICNSKTVHIISV